MYRVTTKKGNSWTRLPEAAQGVNTGIFEKIKKCQVGEIDNYFDPKQLSIWAIQSKMERF